MDNKNSKEIMLNESLDETNNKHRSSSNFSEGDVDQSAASNPEAKEETGCFTTILRQELESKSPKFNFKMALCVHLFLFFVFLIFSLPNIMVYSNLSEVVVDYSHW